MSGQADSGFAAVSECYHRLLRDEGARLKIHIYEC